MYHQGIRFGPMLRIAAAASFAVVLVFTGCSEDSPEAPQVYILHDGASDDAGNVVEFIPTGAKFCSFYLDGDSTVANLQSTADGLTGLSRMLISRIDYKFMMIPMFPMFEFLDTTTGGVLKRYQLPMSELMGATLGTITLTYPIDGSRAGGGISFEIGDGTAEGKVDAIRLTGAGEDDFAVVFGYAWNP